MGVIVADEFLVSLVGGLGGITALGLGWRLVRRLMWGAL